MVIELKNEQLTVQFSEFGGTLSSIKDKDDVEYLCQGNPEYLSGQAPVLFPICGSLRNDWAIYRPAERPHFTGIIPRHGLVRSDRSGCQRKRIAGEIPMIELTIQIPSSM